MVVNFTVMIMISHHGAYVISLLGALTYRRAAFGQGLGSILERTYCWGSEVELTECNLVDNRDTYTSSCTHREDIGVRCCK